LLAGRFAFRSVAALRGPGSRVMILGSSEIGIAIAEAIAARPNAGIELAGFLCDDFDEYPDGISGYPVLGPLHQLEKLLDSAEVDTIICASKQRDEAFPSDELLHAKFAGVRVESGLSFYERLTGRIHLRNLRPSYLIFSEGFHSSRLAEGVRRAVDIALSVAALATAAPVLGLCALAIRLDSKGPVFYRQERVGKGGRSFRVLKLRTMQVDAEKSSGAIFACQRDPRATRVGRILRMTRLDEVPQYWNVLVGDMSIVGPRPERPEFMDILASRYPLFRLRLAQKPGLTGWAQVRYGYVSDVAEWEHKLGLDLYYLKHRSLLFDALIILQTVKTVLLFRGL
jgi:exopolysaccharide biosynthesis polyprenyl glycosylphosphotransferase